MRISDWSSDVCSSDLAELHVDADAAADRADGDPDGQPDPDPAVAVHGAVHGAEPDAAQGDPQRDDRAAGMGDVLRRRLRPGGTAVVRGDAALPPGAAGQPENGSGSGWETVCQLLETQGGAVSIIKNKSITEINSQ